jgi:hypothetical protein
MRTFVVSGGWVLFCEDSSQRSDLEKHFLHLPSLSGEWPE